MWQYMGKRATPVPWPCFRSMNMGNDIRLHLIDFRFATIRRIRVARGKTQSRRSLSGIRGLIGSDAGYTVTATYHP